MTTKNLALTGRVIPTFFYYVVPSIIGLVAITSANLIDGVFIGTNVGTDALAAITLMVPYFTFLIALAIMLAIGGSVSAGKAIGENNLPLANKVFSQSLMVIACISTLLALISLFFSDSLFSLLKIPQDIRPLASDYFDVIRWVFIIQLTTMVLYYFVRADGHPILATAALVTGAVLNIVLDAWFIIYLDFGLAGAAYATAIAQVIQFAVLSRYFFSKHRTLVFSFMQRTWSPVKESIYNGFSEFINEISVGIIFLILNTLMLARSGVDGIAAFTLVNYFIFLSVMISYGFADALHLVVSQNYGAKQLSRVQGFLTVALASSLTLGLTVIFFLFFYSELLLGWFINSNDHHIYQASSELLPLILPLFLVNGSNIVLTCYLTAVHKPKPSVILAITRNLLLPVMFLTGFYFFSPLESILPAALHDISFIVALPLAEWTAFLLALYLCSQYQPKKLLFSSQ